MKSLKQLKTTSGWLHLLVEIQHLNEYVSIFSSEEVCPIAMDTTFVIDASLCDDLGNWNRVLKFVQKLVTFFDVSQPVGRIALIPFSTNATVVLKFNTLTGSLLNGDEVNRRVGLLQCQGGSRQIDKALELANKEVLSPAGGMRDVSRVIKILNDYNFLRM